jgi:hypothetical protein
MCLQSLYETFVYVLTITDMFDSAKQWDYIKWININGICIIGNYIDTNDYFFVVASGPKE